jgi:hypothetical protein
MTLEVKLEIHASPNQSRHYNALPHVDSYNVLPLRKEAPNLNIIKVVPVMGMVYLRI